MRHAKVFRHFFLWVLIFFFLNREATGLVCVYLTASGRELTGSGAVAPRVLGAGRCGT